jgi:alpha-mannosidase
VSITTKIELKPAATSLDFTANVDWHAKEKFLKVDLPVSIQALNAQYECQYGLVERPIAKNTRSDEAKFESCTHRFVRIADASYAAAVVNATTYGSDVSPLNAAPEDAQGSGRGTMVRLSLLSSPLYPDPRTDQGRHSFTWSVVAQADMKTVLSQAARINAPRLTSLAKFDPLVSLKKVKGVAVLDWIKLADDGSGDLILRMYEAAGGRSEGELHICDEMRDCLVQETNLLEGGDLQSDLPRALVSAQPQRAEGAKFVLEPFQLATLRISRNNVSS